MKSRTRARSVALQALYEIDISGHLPGQVLQERLADEPLGDPALEDFARTIVLGILPCTSELDATIA